MCCGARNPSVRPQLVLLLLVTRLVRSLQNSAHKQWLRYLFFVAFGACFALPFLLHVMRSVSVLQLGAHPSAFSPPRLASPLLSSLILAGPLLR